MRTQSYYNRIKIISRGLIVDLVDMQAPLIVLGKCARQLLVVFGIFLSLQVAQAQQSCNSVFSERVQYQDPSAGTRIVSKSILRLLNRSAKSPDRAQVVIDNKIEILGKLQGYALDSKNQIAYVNFSGPTRLSNYHPTLDGYRAGKITGQGETQHAQGFGTAVGEFKIIANGESLASTDHVFKLKVAPLVSNKIVLEFDNGVVVRGTLSSFNLHPARNQVSILSFTDCLVTRGDQVLFDPSWGTYDMIVGTQVSSVLVN